MYKFNKRIFNLAIRVIGMTYHTNTHHVIQAYDHILGLFALKQEALAVGLFVQTIRLACS
jgi:hypothetical protein